MSTDETKVGHAAPAASHRQEDAADQETTFYRPGAADPLEPDEADLDEAPDPSRAKTSGDGDTVVITLPDGARISEDSAIAQLGDHTPHTSTAHGMRLGDTALRLVRLASLRLEGLKGVRPSADAAKQKGSDTSSLATGKRHSLAFAGSVLAGLIVGGLAVGVAFRGNRTAGAPVEMESNLSGSEAAISGPQQEVSIKVAASPREADVFVDGERLPNGTHQGPCDGPVSIRVWAPGHITKRYTIECGSTVMIIVNLDEELEAME